MVKVFEKCEIESFFEICVAHSFGEFRREIHRELLVSYGVFESAFVYGFEKGEFELLLFFQIARKREFASEIRIRRMSFEVVREPIRFEFRSVHQYYTRFGVRIYGVLVVRTRIQCLPVFKKFFD